MLAIGCGSAPNTVGATDAPPSIDVTLGVIQATPSAFVAYRDGDRDWQVPPAPTLSMGQFDYTLRVTDDYLVLIVCGGSDASPPFTSRTLARTVAEGLGVTTECALPSPPPTDIHITGQMLQPGTVSVDGVSTSSATGPWTYALDVDVAAELLAVGSDGNAVISDQYTGSDATNLTGPTIDVDGSGGAALEHHPLAVVGAGSDALEVQSVLSTTGFGDTISDGSASELVVLPPSLLALGDEQSVFVIATTPTTQRVATTMVDPAVPPTTLALLEPLAATFDQTPSGASVTWSTVPLSTYDDLTLFSTDAAGSTQVFGATRDWVATRDATSLAFDASAPLFQQEGSVERFTTVYARPR